MEQEHSTSPLHLTLIKGTPGNILKIIVLTLFLISLSSCNCDNWGAYNLGDKFVLLEGAHLEDRIIVYCTGYSGGCCNTGISVIPTYENHYNEQGDYAHYVKVAQSDNKWIIAKTIQIKNHKEEYWIINKNYKFKKMDCFKVDCDSIIQSNIIGPLESNVFKNKTNELNIKISFN